MGALRVPDLGRVEGGIVLVAWLASDGETVAEGQEVVELETSKVTFAVEAPRAGVLSTAVSVGETVDVGDVLGRLA